MKKQFIFVHEEPNVNLLNLQVHLQAFCDPRLKEIGQANLRAVWYSVENHRFAWGPHGADWESSGRTYLAKMKSDSDFALRSERKVAEVAAAIQTAAYPLLENNRHATVSDQERVALIRQFFDWNLAMCAYGYIGPVMEMPNEFVTKELHNLIDLHASYFKRSRGEYIVTLSTPIKEFPTAPAHRDLLTIAWSIAKDPAFAVQLSTATTLAELGDSEVIMALKAHLERFPWIMYSYRGPLWTEEKVLEELRHLLSLPDLSVRLETEEKGRIQLAEDQRACATELQLSPEEEGFLAEVRSIAYTKVLRKDMLSLGNYMIHLLGRPLWERYGLSFEDIDMYTVEEFVCMLESGNTVPYKEIEARKHFVLYLQTRDGHQVLTGEKAREWIKDNVDFGADVGTQTQVKGTVASLGEKGATVHGLIKRVEVPEDMQKFNTGDILVSSGTTPDLLLAMRRAGAIVTDTGGLTSHAAIVSRELKIPCVIGTQIATKVFKDGDHVEVDIKRGIVKKI